MSKANDILLLLPFVGPRVPLNRLTIALAGLLSESGNESACAVLAKSDIVARLCSILPVSTACAKTGWSILANLSDNAELEELMIGSHVVGRAIGTLLDSEQSEIHQVAAMVLAQLTRTDEGLKRLLYHGSSANDEQREKLRGLVLVRLARRVLLLNELGAENDKSGSEFFSMVLSNATRDEGSRRLLVKYGQDALLRLLSAFRAEGVFLRRGAIGTLRNLAHDTDAHKFLVEELCVVPAFLERLMPYAPKLSSEDRARLPGHVRDASSSPLHEVEAYAESRLLSVEALILLCASEIGRNSLIESGADVVILEAEKGEEDDEVRSRLVEAGELVLRATRLRDAAAIVPDSDNGEDDDDFVDAIAVPEADYSALAAARKTVMPQPAPAAEEEEESDNEEGEFNMGALDAFGESGDEAEAVPKAEPKDNDDYVLDEVD